MPGVDWIPGVSQLKATLQAVTGDTEGAKRTMVNFVRECPGVSQVTSVVQLAAGDAEGALETQKICLGTVNNVANGIPVVGHVKGAIHHAVGDHEGGNQALNAATRTTVVVASGAAAAVATGGIGAIPAGITAGITYDAAATVITDEEQGSIAALKNAVENPSAGSIFDAVAVPVGDGIAGYSGGQIAKKITINRLESARAVKLQELDAVYDGKSGGNSGTAVKLGREINSMTSEINTMKHGTPKYWVDPKTGEVGATSTGASTGNAIPMTGYVDDDGTNQKKKLPVKTQPGTSSERITREQPGMENALYYDSYVESITTEKNIDENRKRLQKLEEQALQGKIHETYKNVNSTLLQVLKDLLERINMDFCRDPNRNLKNLKKDTNQVTRRSWLPLTMPQEFSYTGIVQLNSVYQGLHHSFIRHMEEWRDVISIDATLIQRLSPIMPAIRNLSSAQNQTDAEIAHNEFQEALELLSSEIRDVIQVALVEIQILIYRFIQDNITIDNYLGRDVNTNGAEQLLFRVKTRDGRTVVMVVCVSNQRFDPEPGDSRAVRIGITVFFRPWARFQRQRITETKEEMLKKQKNSQDKK
ncbi:uncharacterized protein LOC106643444 [Copidosoma floridanum]|uniref:uncharacterized protein LOC106643444 n=1 Tax=Copidosoma floridanum TaxID=29053 RepID=UPI0006C9574D|nr:uncharacterized protein LOC106643444 [Copidosoma floridanum]